MLRRCHFLLDMNWARQLVHRIPQLLIGYGPELCDSAAKLCSSFHVVQHPPDLAPESSLFRAAADADSGTEVGIVFKDYCVIVIRIGVLRTIRRGQTMEETVNNADAITLTLSASALKCWVLSHWANVVSGTQPQQFGGIFNVGVWLTEHPHSRLLL